LRLRIGRQEIEFGTGHLIGESEGLNIRRAFDGFRFTFKHGRWTWNSTLTHPVLVRPQAFDIPDHRQTEWGAGFTRARELGGWSGYYIGLNRKQAVFNGMAGQEVRETFAAVFGTKEVSSITTPISSCRAEHPAAGKSWPVQSPRTTGSRCTS